MIRESDSQKRQNSAGHESPESSVGKHDGGSEIGPWEGPVVQSKGSPALREYSDYPFCCSSLDMDWIDFFSERHATFYELRHDQSN